MKYKDKDIDDKWYDDMQNRFSCEMKRLDSNNKKCGNLLVIATLLVAGQIGLLQGKLCPKCNSAICNIWILCVGVFIALVAIFVLLMRDRLTNYPVFPYRLKYISNSQIRKMRSCFDDLDRIIGYKMEIYKSSWRLLLFSLGFTAYFVFRLIVIYC